MISRINEGSATGLPPLEKGRSAREASRVEIKRSRFDLTKFKTARARRLSRNSTDVEMKLWQRVRNRQIGADFRRQHPAGPFVLDFYCPALRLAIELDGGQHAKLKDRDRERDAWLAARGVKTLRFWNSDVVENCSGVLEVIAAKISELQATEVIPTRRWRHSRCSASASLAPRTAAEGRLCLPFSRGGSPDSRHR